jgi:hypothetical protein
MPTVAMGEEYTGVLSQHAEPAPSALCESHAPLRD